MKTFQQWLEDAGEAFPRINDASYENKGVRSKQNASDSFKPDDGLKNKKPSPVEDLFGIKRSKMKKK